MIACRRFSASKGQQKGINSKIKKNPIRIIPKEKRKALQLIVFYATICRKACVKRNCAVSRGKELKRQIARKNTGRGSGSNFRSCVRRAALPGQRIRCTVTPETQIRPARIHITGPSMHRRKGARQEIGLPPNEQSTTRKARCGAVQPPAVRCDIRIIFFIITHLSLYEKY